MMSIFEFIQRTLPWSRMTGPLTLTPLTSGLLLSLALLSGVYGWQVRHSPRRRALQRFYYSQALLLLTLGLDKQWGLLDQLTSYNRMRALRDGWYSTRHTFQLDLIIGILLASLLLFGVACWCFRTILRYHWLPLVGALGLLAFVTVRAVSFHNVDSLMADRIWGVRLDGLYELGSGLFLLGTLTLAFFAQQKRDQR